MNEKEFGKLLREIGACGEAAAAAAYADAAYADAADAGARREESRLAGLKQCADIVRATITLPLLSEVTA